MLELEVRILPGALVSVGSSTLPGNAFEQVAERYTLARHRFQLWKSVKSSMQMTKKITVVGSNPTLLIHAPVV